MALFGRSFPQRSRILGIPPTEAPGPAPDQAPVGAMLGLTAGGRQGRGTPNHALTQYAPRPLGGGGGPVIYNETPSITITLTATLAELLALAEAPGVTLNLTATEIDALSASETVTATLTLTLAPGDTFSGRTARGGHGHHDLEILLALQQAARRRRDEEVILLTIA